MIYLIDPANLKGKKCKKYECDIVCKLCITLCPLDIIQPLYSVPPEEG